MHLKELLIKYLRLFGGDTRQAVVGYLVLALLASGGLLAISKTALTFLILELTIPVPLWATISLVLLGCVYTYVRLRQKYHTFQPSTKNAPILSQENQVEYFPVDDYEWKVEIHKDGSYSIAELPMCKDHNLPFIAFAAHFCCPEVLNHKCHNKIYPSDLPLLHATAKSYIEKEIRNMSNPESSNKPVINQNSIVFHTAFAPALAQIDLDRKHTRFDVSPAPNLEKFLSDSLSEQATAIQVFSIFVPENQRPKYREAWDKYRSAVAFGFVTTGLRQDIDDPHAMYEQLIHNILAFAKIR